MAVPINNKIAILIPCYNEEKTVEKVVKDFFIELPEADIYVYDNNSKDATFEKAVASGAIVRREKKQGKGNVVRSMFRNIEANIYILVDGDDTYPAENVHAMISAIHDGADMAVGDRLSNKTYSKENKRPFHEFGNILVRWSVNKFFKADISDVMSGYRAFSRRFVKNYPVLFEGFQIETDMTIFSLHRFFEIKEVPVTYRDRPKGSISKLNTYKDGFKVLIAILNSYRYYKPLRFFSYLAGIFFIAGIVIGIPVFFEYIRFGYIYKVPSAILASGLAILSSLFLMSGFILDAIHHGNREAFEVAIRKIH